MPTAATIHNNTIAPTTEVTILPMVPTAKSPNSDKIAAELADTMQMCGAHSLAEITRDMVRI